MHLDSPPDALIRWVRTRQVSRLVPQGTSVCDVGCGENPVMLKALREKISKGVGIDILVENGRDGNLELRRGDFTKRLPIADGEFGTITMLAIIEHLENPAPLLRECGRGLRRSGRIILTTPSPPSKPVLELLAWLHVISRKEIFDHKHYYNKEEIEGLLAAAGFRDVKAWAVSFGLNNMAVGFKK